MESAYSPGKTESGLLELGLWPVVPKDETDSPSMHTWRNSPVSRSEEEPCGGLGKIFISCLTENFHQSNKVCLQSVTPGWGAGRRKTASMGFVFKVNFRGAHCLSAPPTPTPCYRAGVLHLGPGLCFRRGPKSLETCRVSGWMRSLERTPASLETCQRACDPEKISSPGVEV